MKHKYNIDITLNKLTYILNINEIGNDIRFYKDGIQHRGFTNIRMI